MGGILKSMMRTMINTGKNQRYQNSTSIIFRFLYSSFQGFVYMHICACT